MKRRQIYLYIIDENDDVYIFFSPFFSYVALYIMIKA